MASYFWVCFRKIGLVSLVFALIMTSSVNAGSTSYSGSICYGQWSVDHDPDDPVQNGFVILGTFEPGFDVSQYNYAYGDEVGNMFGTYYSQAVADGVFRPLGSGTYTQTNGSFSGYAATSNPDHYGSQLYLFCFDDSNPDWASNFGICTSTDSAWVLDSENRTLAGSDVDQFLFGNDGAMYGYDIALQCQPMPEPSTIAMLSSGLVMLCIAGIRRRRNRVS